MNSKLSFIILLLGVLQFCVFDVYAEDDVVFPGAVGFGVDTSAGYGGRVIKVTNLDAKGPGSLREALEVSGPRIVVFEVGGVIDLDMRSISISKPFLTVAGQTAPSPGITLIRGGLSISTHDVLIQHICVRPGDAGQPKKSGWSPDGIATNAAWNVVIDHCSVTWAVDENLSASGPRQKGPENTSHDVTFSNCIIAEGLDESSHEKGRHSKGSLIHDTCTNIAIIGNFYAHNVDRNPYFKANVRGVIVNNLIYNPGRRAIKFDWPESEWQGSPKPRDPVGSIVGNVLIHGKDTKEDVVLVAKKGDAYMEDNLAFDRSGNPIDLIDGTIRLLDEKPLWPKGLKAVTADDLIPHILETVGARPWDRDPIDLRIIQDFQKREGRIIDSQDEVGGYPERSMTRRALDVPQQNVREWLNEFTVRPDQGGF